MVASTNITILPIYLDGTSKSVLNGGVSTLDDDTVVHKSDSRTVSTTERSDRVAQSWQLSWGTASSFIVKLFKIVRKSKGFLFISPLPSERIFTGQPLKNTVTGLTHGDGSTTTFQLQYQESMSYDIGVGTASTDAVDVNYPLSGTVVGYKAGVSATCTYDLLTGIVTFASAPGNGVATTADYERAFAAMFISSVSQTMINVVDRTEVRSAQIEEII